MRAINKTIILGLAPLLLIGAATVINYDDWGFFGHKRINRMAVFTLPSDLIPLYKQNIEYITEHAVDADKRRYATKHEAVRHYIDIDHWDTHPFEKVPRDWTSTVARYTDIYFINNKGDTTQVFGNEITNWEAEETVSIKESLGKKFFNGKNQFSKKAFLKFAQTQFANDYPEVIWSFSPEIIKEHLDLNTKHVTEVIAFDRFSKYGVLPYHLERVTYRLTEAFRKRNLKAILRLSCDIGHYLGDAHVPLHTTENYNGQFTNQHGIHAFWESRLPELFADNEYNYFVGKAKYIKDKRTFFWNTILKSHSYLDSVLAIENDLKKTFPQDLQFCFEMRNDISVRTQCEAFSRAYHERLKGQVEERMRSSIHGIGSVWYTCWVDAGQPKLKDIMGTTEVVTSEEKERLNQLFKKGEAQGRGHGQ